jgi:hypothetical protein
VVLLGPLLGSSVAGAASAQASGSDPTPPRGYVPPKVGAPDNRVSGATRGPEGEAMQLAALAPPDVGLTAREQPRLYWFNSRPIGGGASITIIDDATNRTVFKATVPGPLPAGINSFPMAGTHGRISDDTAYRWSLTVVLSTQDPSRNPVASGLIERVARPGTVGGGKPPAAGLWYDEVDSISQSIRRAPGDRSLRQARSTLLEQAGLTEAAAYDRAASR